MQMLKYRSGEKIHKHLRRKNLTFFFPKTIGLANTNEEDILVNSYSTFLNYTGNNLKNEYKTYY